MTEARSLDVHQEYDVPSVRILATEAARAIGLPDRQRHFLLTAVTELATNLCFHAQHGGRISIGVVKNDDGHLGIEIIAEDEGPGIDNLDLAMRDGYSTAGGLGYGLPAARRLVDDFAIQSASGEGTRIVARIWRR